MSREESRGRRNHKGADEPRLTAVIRSESGVPPTIQMPTRSIPFIYSVLYEGSSWHSQVAHFIHCLVSTYIRLGKDSDLHHAVRIKHLGLRKVVPLLIRHHPLPRPQLGKIAAVMGMPECPQLDLPILPARIP